MPPFLVDTLLRGMESFTCQEGEIPSEMNVESYKPLIPPTITWALLTALLRYWPIGLILLAISLAGLLWLLSIEKRMTISKRLLWVLLTVVLGPVGLLIFVIVRQRRRQLLKGA